MPARHAILGLLMKKPQHGYDIDGEFDRGLRRVCHVNISQIYAYLKNMEAQQWLESETIPQESNPPKKVFHVTEKGEAEMRRWLSEPVATDRQVRDELLTKIFVMWLLAPEQLPELLDAQIDVQRAEVEALQRRREQAEDFLQRTLSEASVRHAEVDLQWLTWLREQALSELAELSQKGAVNGKP